MSEREFLFTAQDFRYLTKLVYGRTGIVLGESKHDLVYGRLARRLRELKLTRFQDYCDRLRSEGEDGTEMAELINAITTNHTAFFREPHHFSLLEEQLRDWRQRAGANPAARLRLWSAAASIGAEAYSMAMCVCDAIPDAAQRDIRILATDIDTTVLAKAEEGRFPAAMAKTIPPRRRDAYIRQMGTNTFIVSPMLRELIRFQPLNLLENWPMRGGFDIIFCRNVVIYFDKPTQIRLFDNLANQLKVGSWLYIGHSESLHNLSDRFEPAGKTVYRKVR